MTCAEMNVEKNDERIDVTWRLMRDRRSSLGMEVVGEALCHIKR